MDINKLNLPENSKDFLLKHKISENEFESLNIEFYNNSNGFLFDVVKWTIKNDFSLTMLEKDYKDKFLASLEKFRQYLVIALNLNTDNLITIHQPTGEIYELEHEITDKVERYFVNASLEKMYLCLDYFKKSKINVIKNNQYNNIKIAFDEIKNKLAELDIMILINEDDFNKQFWNSLYLTDLNFFMRKAEKQ